ncbi:hypothetical protein [Parasitella parasitica]|uniref:Uncharacterized protein n=1 Tax=Parasitella parasitica TaxID=35722 RepID=A0A0B7NRU8_9FUNG|nr:hypothetical protein [Parasitella parasitica]
MYERLVNKYIGIDLKIVNRLFQPAVSQTTDAIDIEGFRSGIESLRSVVATTTAAEKALIYHSLEQILEVIAGAGRTLSSSEGCPRFYVVDPLLRTCNDFLLQHGRNVLFFPGEIELNAMTTQLQSQGITDGRLKYNADGKILVEELSTEILLSEVSSSFGENSKGKTSFDHHKAMFGLLAMVRTIASLCQHSSFDTFFKLKLHFIHTHDRAIRHWTMSTPSPGVYVMNKEQRVGIIDDFGKQKNNTVQFVTFALTLASALEETMAVLDDLTDEHDRKETAYRFERNVPRPSLLELVCPQIVRLNENKHTVQIADDGTKSPVYTPNA